MLWNQYSVILLGKLHKRIFDWYYIWRNILFDV